MDESEKFLLNEIYQQFSLEWFGILRKYDDDAKYKEGRELLDWRRKQCEELIEVLKRQKRDLDFRAGEHKPETLFAETIMEGKLGGIL